MNKINLGCYNYLAKNYSKYRPSYSSEAINFLKLIINKKELDLCLDIGAGTGIFTRKLQKIFKKIYAVELSKEMISEGKRFKSKKINWINSSAEKINLKNKKFNLVSAASCFHWIENKKLAKKLIPIMKKNSYFFIIYNSRNTSYNNFSRAVEKKLNKLNKSYLKKRVSSGQSSSTEDKINKFSKIANFTNPIKFNLYHQEKFSKKKYIGAWMSANEARAKIGNEKFKIFIKWLDKTLKPKDIVETQYINKCFLLQKKY